jgi:hypothetical protein
MSDPQSIIVLGLVSLSAAYVGWTIASRFRKRGGKACGSACSGCTAEQQTVGTKKQLVELTPAKKP